MSRVEFFDAFEAVQTANLLAQVLLNGPVARARLGFAPVERPYFAPICGVGVLDDAVRGGVAPLLLKDAGPNPSSTRPIPITEASDLRELVRDVMPHNRLAWEGSLVIEVTSPRSYAASGDAVAAAHHVGIAGAKVVWGQPVPLSTGLLTAGHVVGSNTTARVGSSSGNIAFADNFINSGTRAKPDVAVIELSNASPASTITGMAVPASQEWLDILTKGGTKKTQVLGKLIWLYFPADKGTAGELYLTYPGITIPGDSGAAAVRSAAPNEVVGHVIGGSPGSADYIQDIRYQLNAINLAGIAI
jgi:hypothetical protein